MKELEKKHFDLVVVGGGIQGAGIARDAAMQGLNVLLCEKDDFLNATSSQSSKLIHGGLRYLESFEFKLVQESLYERKTLLSLAKHAVYPLRFIIPKFKNNQRPLWIYRLGLFIYDFLAGKKNIQKHGKLQKSTLSRLFNFLPDDIHQAIYYYDAYTDDFRLGLDWIVDAKKHGAICLNYSSVDHIDQTQQGFDLIIHTHSKNIQVSTKTLVNAAGPWANDIIERMKQNVKSKIKFGKGIHIVFETDHVIEDALLLEIPNENRIFFVLPWKNRVLVGTTDTEFTGELHQVKADLKDISYLKAALERYVHKNYLKQMKPVALMAGVRPLVMKDEKSSQELSRGYAIEKQLPGMWSILGGKYTVFREIGEKTVRLILNDLKKPYVSSHSKKPLMITPSATLEEFLENSQEKIIRTLSIHKNHADDLLKRYGTGWENLIPYFKSFSVVSPWCSKYPYYPAELLYSIDHEFCKTLEDYMLRRTSLFYTETSGVDIVDGVLDIMIEKDILSKKEAEEQKNNYFEKVKEQKSILNAAF